MAKSSPEAASHPRQWIDAEHLASFSTVRPWGGAARLAGEWSLVLGAVLLAEASGTPFALLASVPWIAARQHALVALAHEAAHGRLARGRWNLGLGETLAAWPLFLSVASYREVHRAHHLYLNTPRDPDWVRNRPDRFEAAADRRARWRQVLGLGGGQRSLLALFGARDGGADWRRLSYYAVAAAAISALGGWQLVALHWLLPLVIWLPLLLRARGISEHWATRGTGALAGTRTLQLGAAGRWLFLPGNMGYHLEHHLFPEVPAGRLPELHAALVADPRYAGAHVTRGLGALLRELARPAAAPSAEGGPAADAERRTVDTTAAPPTGT